VCSQYVGDDGRTGLTKMFLELQQQQPQLYENLTKILTPEEQSVVQTVIQQAEVNAIAAASRAAETNGGSH